MWLEAPVDETDDQGRTRRTTRNKDSKRGIPQGSPISPLLSNLYRRRLVLGWKRLGYERRFDARTVSYADDLVICCRHQADEALVALRQVASRIGLTVNEDKTHVCRLPEGRFTFLGYSFERCYSEKTGRSYLGTRPSKKSIQRMVESISAQTERKTLSGRRNGVCDEPMVGWALLLPREIVPKRTRQAPPGCASTRSSAMGRHDSRNSTCTRHSDWSICRH
jgi:RNA-directed DNA polymerase